MKSAVSCYLLFVCVLLVSSCASELKGSFEDPRLIAGDSARFLIINSILVHYTDSAHDSSSQDLPVLILMHGFGGNLANFSAVTDELARFYRVIAFDRPPFGYSQKALPGDYAENSPYSAQQQADYAIQIMDALGIDSAVLVGHSAGGAAALRAAIRNSAKIDALVLVSPAVAGAGPPSFTRRLIAVPPIRWLGPWIVRRSFARSEGILERSFYNPDAITDEIRQQYRIGSELANWDRALWQFSIESGPADDNLDYSELAIPVLITGGAEDEIVDPAQSIRLHEQLPNSELQLMEGVGHIAFQEKPAGFLEIVLPWLAGLTVIR